MSAPDYGRSFVLWRAAAVGAGRGPWAAYTCHGFVEGLRDGSLPRAAFLEYLVQDYLFLRHFARAWALAAVKADSVEEMTAALAVADAILNEEMELHVGVCAAAGISRADLDAAEELPGTIAYTRYVLDAGFSGDLLDLLAALAPCVLGYGEIGARLLAEATPGTPYADWIAVYGSEDYQALCRRTGALIDGAVAARLGAHPERLPRWQGLTARFLTATRAEAAFWIPVRA